MAALRPRSFTPGKIAAARLAIGENPLRDIE
jgi:hypothetical protein